MMCIYNTMKQQNSIRTFGCYTSIHMCECACAHVHMRSLFCDIQVIEYRCMAQVIIAHIVCVCVYVCVSR